MSKIYVDEIASKTGAADALSIGVDGAVTIKHPAGGIVQIQYDQYTGTTTQALTANTYAPLDIVSVTITPTSSNSIIKLDGQLFGEFGNDGSEWNHILFFYRDSTQLGHPSAGSRYVGVGMLNLTYPTTSSNNSTTPNFGQWTFFDTPNTTNAITYKLGILTVNTETFYINRCVNDDDTAGRERGVSFISATEIAG